WKAPGGQLGYVLLVLPLGGSPRTVTLGAGATNATDQTGGAFTCYLQHPVYQTSVGRSDAVCALPGAAHFTAAAAQPATAKAAAGPLGNRPPRPRRTSTPS